MLREAIHDSRVETERGEESGDLKETEQLYQKAQDEKFTPLSLTSAHLISTLV